MFDATANRTNQCPARTALDELMAWVGVDGHIAALNSPGLLAALDQHAAAVRDSLSTAGHRIDAPPLARYATSIIAAAHRMGRALPDRDDERGPAVDWSRPGWHLLRLVAVCGLAEDHGCL
jgi:hypothetical protein